MVWAVVYKEDELFELDDVRDQDKLWNLLGPYMFLVATPKGSSYVLGSGNSSSRVISRGLLGTGLQDRTVGCWMDGAEGVASTGNRFLTSCSITESLRV
ncbi:hypothetical protein FA95DRAFT_929255 [Auriscalpium vulgare]|uniref:Uncharacterized protein n=1 Tax=Auriscalpium vulgare TaxID=40419 RepID=A0ACB8R814_9AGAM|nr:hypothetical protein FA95DRAFT_929255 [Auriscalpium vulgare]